MRRPELRAVRGIDETRLVAISELYLLRVAEIVVRDVRYALVLVRDKCTATVIGILFLLVRTIVEVKGSIAVNWSGIVLDIRKMVAIVM